MADVLSRKKDGSITESRSLRIGFLGVGKVALEHAITLKRLGQEVVAGCATDVGSPRWRSFVAVAKGARFESDGEALLNDPDIDAIVACLPWNVTGAWLPRLLTTPKPVLIEKPIALSSRAAEAALSTPGAKPHNKIVGFNRRFYAPVQQLKERLGQGGLKAVEMNISETLQRLHTHYGPEVIPHAVIYSSSHILDTAIYLLGSLTPVRVYGYEEKGYPLPFRSLTGLLETREGLPVTFSINADNPVPVGLRLYFDDKTTWHLSPMERLVAYRGYEVIEATPKMRIQKFMPRPFFESVADATLKPGCLEQMRAFTTGEGKEIAATPAESVELLRFIEALYNVHPSDPI